MKEPKIRFKEFKGEWETSFVGEVCKISTGKSNTQDKIEDGEFPFYVRSPYVERSNKYLYDEEAVLTIGDGVGTGKVFHYVNGKYDLHQRVYRMFDFHNIQAKFFYYLFSTKFYRRVMSMTAKSSVDSVRMDMIANMKIDAPAISEQQRIASFFTTIDAQISASTSRLASLKQIKAASLQAMFPQEGETVPKLRFKGFEGEWEKVSFKKLYDPSTIKNKTFGADKIISVANMYYKPISYISDEEYLKSYNVMNLGDIAFEGNKSKNYAHDRFVENTIGDGIVSHVFIVLKPISKQYDLLFWKYLINYESIMGPVLSRCTKHSTMMTDLVVSDFLKESVLIPSYEEQKYIGTFLQNLDRQITLQARRLEKLKQIKAACLDKMFV